MVNQTSVEAVGNLTKSTESNSTDGEHPKQWTRCPAHTVNIGGFCKRMFFVGQPGCEVDSQCSARTDGTSCVKGYCACPAPLLIYESKCVLQCPDGFLNIAGRCHDLTSIVFMDSVENRENGTIGGFCLATVVAEEQCEVENAYCSEKSLTCQCQPGYQLRIEEISNRTEKGVCMEVEGSRFQGAAASRRLRDQVEDDANLETFGVGPTFYAVEFSADAANETVEATEKIGGENDSQSQSMEEEKSGSKTVEELSKKEKEEVSEEGLKSPSRNAHANESLSDDDGARSTRQEEERVLFQADD